MKIKPLIFTVLLITFQTICYFVSKLLQDKPILIGNFIDDKIPFIIIFIIPYCIWYLLIFVVPYYIYIKDRETYIKYFMSYILCTIIANIIFIIYPTTVSRPIITTNGILSYITNVVFKIDTPVANCFPSLHCAVSMLFILYIFKCRYASKIFKYFILFISIMIMISTLTIKQHVFIDLVSGNILAIIVYFIVNKLYIALKNNDIIKKI